MKKLYKYMSTQHVQDALTYGIFAGNLTDFNDPYESIGIRYPNRFRVVSLTGSPRKMLMWAHYGNHTGCCVGFNFEADDSICRKVTYTPDFYERRELKRDEVKDYLFLKAKEWEYENETRIVFDSDHEEKRLWLHVDNPEGEKVFYRACVCEIIFGLRVDFESEATKSLIHFLQNNDTELDISMCMLSRLKYEILIDKQFDYRRAGL